MAPNPRPRDRIAGIVLAAGRSRRFGSAKQLALLEGRTLLEHVLHLAVDAGLEPVVAIVPVWLTRPASAGGGGLRWVRNPYPERGVSHSLRLGFEALPAATQAAVILLGDQPTLPQASIEAVVAARGDRPIVAAEAGGHLAPPVLVERTAFPLVDALQGDVGLRDLIAHRPDLVRRVPVPRHAPDVDTPDDLAPLAGHPA